MNVFCAHDEAGNVIELFSSFEDELPVREPYSVIQVDTEQPNFLFDAALYFVDIDGAFLRKPARQNNLQVWKGRQWIFDRQFALLTLNSLINQKRDNDFLLTVVFDGWVFDADQTAITNIQSTLLIFQPSGQLPEGRGWRTHDNQTVPMTYAKLEGLAQAIYARNAQIYEESWALKDSLNSKTDEELLALYESLTSPPG